MCSGSWPIMVAEPHELLHTSTANMHLLRNILVCELPWRLWVKARVCRYGRYNCVLVVVIVILRVVMMPVLGWLGFARSWK